jgi:hypothetical protein
VTTQAVITYTINLLGLASAATIQAQMGTVPLPQEYLYSMGAYLVSDVLNTSGTVITRTITLSLVPATSPAATAVVNGANGHLASLTTSNVGDNVIASPVVEIPGVQDAIVAAGLTCVSVPILNGGIDYSLDTYITASTAGQVGPTTGQTFTPNFLDGAISSVTVAGGITGSGSFGNYVFAPTLAVVDPTGEGSEAYLGSPDMRLCVLDGDTFPIVAHGKYDPTAGTPTATFTPRFKYTWPDSIGADAQAAPFVNLIRAALVAVTASPVIETVVVS